MKQCRISRSSLHSWFIACLVLTICTGMPRLLAAALVTPEEVNSVRVYKQMAKSTVLVASAYVSFTRWDLLSAPRWIGASNYTALLHDHTFWVCVRNTLYYTAVSVPAGTILAPDL